MGLIPTVFQQGTQIWTKGCECMAVQVVLL